MRCGREAVNLAVGNRTHQRGLSRVILAHQTIAASTLQLELCVVEQNLVSVGQRELAVAQLFNIVKLLLDLNGLVVLHNLGKDGSSNGISLGLVVGNEGQHVWHNVGGPLLSLEVIAVVQRDADLGNIRKHSLVLVCGGRLEEVEHVGDSEALHLGCVSLLLEALVGLLTAAGCSQGRVELSDQDSRNMLESWNLPRAP